MHFVITFCTWTSGRAFLKGFTCSLLIWNAPQMTSPSLSALQGAKKAIWNSCNNFWVLLYFNKE